MDSFATFVSADEEQLHIPAVKHYHPGVCGTCNAAPSKEKPLLRCSQCQLISYCSKECQKIDWSTHRWVCLVNKARKDGNIFSSAKKIVWNENGKIVDDACWYQLRCNLSLACSINLKRPLRTQERELFLFPRVCEVCKDSTSSILTECSVCHSVFYCCDEHRDVDKNEHSSWCCHYLLCLDCDSLEAEHGIQDLPFPTRVDEAYKSLASDLKTILNSQLEIDSSMALLDRRFITMIGERLSFPLSLLYALEKINEGLKDHSVLESALLRIHVIGAESSVELLGIIRWEYFLHRLPSVMRLHIAFIGPKLLKTCEGMEDLETGNHYVDESGATRCDDCARRGRIVIYEMAAMLYHKFERCSYYSDPDVVVAFNCGFHEYTDHPQETWNESLKLLTKSTVPLIFTSYTRLEAEKDLKAVMKSNDKVQIEIHPRPNPFCSPRPFRDPARDHTNHVYFSNQYLTCVKGIIGMSCGSHRM